MIIMNAPLVVHCHSPHDQAFHFLSKTKLMGDMMTTRLEIWQYQCWNWPIRVHRWGLGLNKTPKLEILGMGLKISAPSRTSAPNHRIINIILEKPLKLLTLFPE